MRFFFRMRQSCPPLPAAWRRPGPTRRRVLWAARIQVAIDYAFLASMAILVSVAGLYLLGALFVRRRLHHTIIPEATNR